MPKLYSISQVSLVTLLILVLSTSGAADTGLTQSIEPPSVLPSYVRQYVGKASLRVSMASYKPQLEQFQELLAGLGSPGIDAALMPFVLVQLTHTPELSSQFGIGYWTNDTTIPPPFDADLSATFVPIAFNLIYRPVYLHDLIPFYVGGGFGYSALNVEGSALDLLEQQGITVDKNNSGLTGYVLIGVEFPVWQDQVMLSLEVRQILKNFTTSGNPPLDLDFDGSAIGVGIEWVF